MNRSQLLVIPLLYTYLTRLNNVRGLLDYLVRDVAIPLIPAIIFFGANGRVALLLWAGFVTLYEVGYILNDRMSSAREAGGDRLRGSTPSLSLSIALRVVLFGGVVLWALSALGGGVAATYAGFGVGVVGLLLVHSVLLTDTVIVRAISFATLALSKYGPPLVPLIGWERGAGLLGAIFLMYGFPRTVHYVVRKTQPAWSAERIGKFQLGAHGLGLFLGLVIVFPDILAVPVHGWTALSALWVLYATAWAVALVSRRLRRQ